ncbi:hypothetical protein IKG07_01340 [Candidatus Saccharibacteria bacterium]|nr:hypothetical protein [Candidatus Saccharibacteria bacterium]
MEYLTTTNLDSVNTLSTSEAAFVGGFVGTMTIAALVFAALVIIGQWKVFEKAGEKGWKSLIPIYGQYILFKIAGAKVWFWVLLGATVLASIMMSANNLPIDWNATQAEIEAELNLVNWSNYIPFILGAVISCLASLVVEIVLAIKLAKAFGKGVSYVLGLIFIPEIVLLVLGFGKAKYDKKVQK